jgi:hypothetical protein
MPEILLAASRKDRRASALVIDERGVTLGPVRLIRAARKQIGPRRFEPCPSMEIAETLAVAFGGSMPFDLDARLHQLRVAAQALSDGGPKTGPMFNNPRNLEMIRRGYDDYMAGKIVPLGK